MAFERKMPRVQAVLLPHLRAQLTPVWPGLKIGSWIESVTRREYPLLNIRRLSGLSNPRRPDALDRPVIELTAYTAYGLVETEELYLDCRKVIIDLVDQQTVTPGVGYVHSFFETMGPTQFQSPFEDTWRVQGLIQLGLRPHE